MIKQKELLPNKRFKEFDEVWKERKLEDVIEGLYNGQTPSRFNDRYWNGDINWLSSGELNKSVVTHTIEKITEEGRKAANLKIVPKNTFVMAITGLEAAGTRGNCAVTGIDTTLNQSCMAIYPNRNLLDSHFLFQWYRKVGETYGLKYTQGTKQQSYNAALVNKLKIILPSKIEQQKIGQFFKHLDEMIAVQQRKIDKTKALKSAYLAEMFPAEEEHVPKRRFEGFMGDWKEIKLGEVAEFNPNSTIPDVFKYVDLESVIGTEIVSYRTEFKRSAPSRAQRLAVRGDIFYQTVRPYQKNNYLYDLPYNNFVFSTGYAQMRPDINGYFLLSQIQEEKFVMKVLNRCTGTGYPAINSNDLANIEIRVPNDRKEQQKIGQFFKHLDEMIATHQQKLEKLKATKQAYLHEMFV